MDLIINQINKPLAAFIINNKEEWKVKNILDSKNYQNKL